MPVPRGKRVQIPRCRATVSEDIADVHWDHLRSKNRNEDLGRTHAEDGLNQVLTRKPGDRREPYLKPLSRVKEDGMIRSLVVRCAISLLLFVPAFAGELQVKVLDPHSAAVAGAQVSLFRVGESVPLQVRTTSGDGLAIFSVDTSASLSVEVLAPGFAAAQTNIEESSSTATVALQVAGA